MVDLSLVHYDSSLGADLAFEVKPKRIKRRLEREKQFGPERKVISFTVEAAVLDCGHTVIPVIQETVHMRQPKYIRCFQCLPIT